MLKEKYMQREVTEKQRLLDAGGNIACPGYAKTMVWQYDRKDIKAPAVRIKEWDYYLIGNQKYALCLTVSDSGYVGCVSASFIDYLKPYDVTRSAISFFPMGRMGLPSTSEKGDVYGKIGKAEMRFENDGVQRKLSGVYKKFDGGKDLKFDITLTDIPEESMVIATPFEKKKHFYYNQKINCMRAQGYMSIGDRVMPFDGDSLATLDWGRGVWTYDNTWLWGSMQTVLEDGSRFGFNIGYGFGDTSAASENMLFYNGKSHKLSEVTFNIPVKDGKDDFMSDWTFTSDDGRLEMDFKPVLDRQAPLDIGVMCMIPHQVFGRFSGRAVLDDGKVIEFKDVIGFAEKVHNKW